MNYKKPAVSTLGDAKTAIEQIQFKPAAPPVELVNGKYVNPAYDLDE
jgi:hypothetical protein